MRQIQAVVSSLLTSSIVAGDVDRALLYCQRIVEQYRRVYPPVHPLLGLQLYTMGSLQVQEPATADAGRAALLESLRILTSEWCLIDSRKFDSTFCKCCQLDLTVYWVSCSYKFDSTGRCECDSFSYTVTHGPASDSPFVRELEEFIASLRS